MSYFNIGPVRACFIVETGGVSDAASVANFIRSLSPARNQGHGGESLVVTQHFEVTQHESVVTVVFDTNLSPAVVEFAHSQVISRLNEWAATSVASMGMGVDIHVPPNVATRLTWSGRVPEIEVPAT